MRTRVDGWPIRARVRAIGWLLAALILLAAWPAIDAYGRATALLGDAVLRLPVSPLTWVTSDPITEELHWPNGGYGVFTRPRSSEPHATLLLVLGAEPADPDDPRVRRLREGLARIGLASLLVRSEPLIDSRVTPDEIPLLTGAFTALRDHPRVRPDRIGMLGLSVGGSLLLVAAADPAIADQVWFVLAIGPYFDAATLALEVNSRSYRTAEGVAVWDPDETAVRVVRRTLLAALSPADVEAIEAGREPPSDDGRVARELLAAPSLERAEQLLPALSPSVRVAFAAVSPSAHLPGPRAPLYLLHDNHDPFIPWTHSEAIASVYTPDTYYRLDMFEHVDPKLGNARMLLRDGSRLLRLFAHIIRER